MWGLYVRMYVKKLCSAMQHLVTYVPEMYLHHAEMHVGVAGVLPSMSGRYMYECLYVGVFMYLDISV